MWLDAFAGWNGVARGGGKSLPAEFEQQVAGKVSMWDKSGLVVASTDTEARHVAALPHKVERLLALHSVDDADGTLWHAF